MKFLKVSPSLLFFILFIFFMLTSQMGIAQPFLGPWGVQWIGNPFYSSFPPFGGAFFPRGGIFPPFYGRGIGWGYPFSPALIPTPTIVSPYQRRPNATIIFTSPTLTAVTTTPGVIIIGATGVLGTPTVVVPAAPTLVAPTGAIAAAIPPTAVLASNPQPAPLFSLLAVLYASATLHGAALLSTANPLLFAYLQTLVF